jgi:ribosomal protein S18 acetylase RimI-like enzyme
MIIRRAIQDDIPKINDLLCQVLNVHHKGRPDIFKAGAKKYKDEELSEIIADNSRPIFVAECDGTVVGYAFCVFIQHENNNILTDIKTLYIDDLCVDENRRGQGIGTALYNQAVLLAKELGCYNLTLNVWSCNPTAIKFYQSLGLTPQKIFMEKIL